MRFLHLPDGTVIDREQIVALQPFDSDPEADTEYHGGGRCYLNGLATVDGFDLKRHAWESLNHMLRNNCDGFPLLHGGEVDQLLGMKPGTADRLARKKALPHVLICGSIIRFDKQVILASLKTVEANKHEPS